MGRSDNSISISTKFGYTHYTAGAIKTITNLLRQAFTWLSPIMMILHFFIEGNTHFFDAICLLLSSLLAIINASLRFNNRTDLLEIVITALICRVNELMGLEEFLVWLFVIVIHLWLQYQYHSNHWTSCFHWLNHFRDISCISSFLKKFND